MRFIKENDRRRMIGRKRKKVTSFLHRSALRCTMRRLIRSATRPHSLVFVLTGGFVAAVCAWLALQWFGTSFSDQELLANYAFAGDFARAWQASGSLPWWSPSFLGGTSLAPFWTSAGTSAWLLIWAAALGIPTGTKAAVVALIAVGALAQFFFIRTLTRQPWLAACAAVFFLLMPPLLVRAIHVEHVSVVAFLAMLPIAFLGIMQWLRRPCVATSAGAGACLALLALADASLFFPALPALIAFGVIQAWSRRGRFALGWKTIVICLATLACLAGAFQLPALREKATMTGYELNPFSDWQQSFSIKSAVLLLDRSRFMSEGMPATVVPETAEGGFYLGLASILGIAIVLLLRPSLLQSRAGTWLKLFLALALLQLWLSYGPLPVLLAQVRFLELSIVAPMWTPAASWAMLIFQGWLIFQLLPASIPARQVVASGVCAIYFLVPGFRLLEWLPMYQGIRAPFDFYQVSGAFCAATAGAIAVWMLLREVPGAAWRAMAAAAVVVLALWDASPLIAQPRTSSLGPSTKADFESAMTYLRDSKTEGSVYMLSGRYFPLLTPLLSGRAVVSKGFRGATMQRGMAEMQTAAFVGTDELQAFLRVVGVAFVVIDKLDRQIGSEIRDRIRPGLSLVFSNAHFDIFEVPSPFGGAFLATEYLRTSKPGVSTALAALRFARFDLAVLEGSALAAVKVGLVGTVEESGVEISDEDARKSAKPFRRVEIAEAISHDFDSFRVGPAGAEGWSVVGQAFHPDWSATAAGTPVPVIRALNGLLGVRATADRELEFRFRAPFWYDVVTIAGLAALVLFPLAICVSGSRMLPLAWRRRIHLPLPGNRGRRRIPGDLPRPAIQRPVVVIPTYNEAGSILECLARTLEQRVDLHILIVDDASSDGTADLIRTHLEYGNRVHLLGRSGKLGLGSAYREGFQWAADKHFDAVVEMDADLSHDPADIPRLLAALDEGQDAAIGSRYIGGVRVLNWPQHRLFLSTGASRYVQTLTRMPLTDPTSGFKAVRVAVLAYLDPEGFRTEGYGFQIELHHQLWSARARMREVPIVFTERRNGSTKMTLRIAVEAAVRVIQLAWEGRPHA